MFGREGLALQVNVRSEVYNLADRPAERDPHHATENSHGAGLGKEELFYISVAGSNRFHNPDLAATFEDRHHQSVHDSDGRHDQGEAPEDSEKRVQHFENLLQAAAGIENRECAETHFFDGILDDLNLRWILHSHT